MKTVKIEKEKSEESMVSYDDDTPRYPYGTTLRFDEDLIKELDISELTVGDEVVVYGVAKVTSKSEHSSQSEGSDYNSSEIEIQMTEVGIGDSEASDATSILYKDD